MDRNKNKIFKKIKQDIHTMIWAINIACKINVWILIGCCLVSVILALLPAIALYYNKEVVFILSQYIATGNGAYSDTFFALGRLAIMLIVIGITQRINGSFLDARMYNAYYFGFQEYLMDGISDIELKTLMDKKYQDNYFSALSRCGSLSTFISAMRLFLSKIVEAIALIIVSAKSSLTLCLFAIVYILTIILINYVMMDKLRWDHRVFQEASRLSDYYQSAVMTSGVAKEIRVYDLSKEMLRQWKEAYEPVVKILKKDAHNRQKLIFFTNLGWVLFLLGIIGYSIYLVSEGQMMMDTFLVMYTMGTSLSQLTSVISQSLTNADNGLFFLTIQRKFIQSIPKAEMIGVEEEAYPYNDEVVFEAKNVCFSYDGKKNVLENITLTIKKGETVALVGKNGSGKSTLVKGLIGLFPITSGELRFCGKLYDRSTRQNIVDKVGMFFQDFYIYHASVRDNVGFGDIKNIKNDSAIIRAINKGGAEKIIAKMQNGMEQWLQKDVLKDGIVLSGGEKQKIAVSRTHMNEKDILIFDEPAAALDPIAEMEQFQAIRDKMKGNTAILISHRVGFARLADRIIVLDKGHMVENGTHEELMHKKGVYAELFNEQAQWYTSEE